jgi:hypothetical protein
MSIYYRVIEDDFSEEDGQEWTVDCLIQTEDPADFDDFDEALNECLERIQERIDRQEDQEDEDGYLDKLREKLGDSSEAIEAGWEMYESCISQPVVEGPDEGQGETHFIAVTSVEGRHQVRQLIEAGVEFSKWALVLLR